MGKIKDSEIPEKEENIFYFETSSLLPLNSVLKSLEDVKAFDSIMIESDSKNNIEEAFGPLRLIQVRIYARISLDGMAAILDNCGPSINLDSLRLS